MTTPAPSIHWRYGSTKSVRRLARGPGTNAINRSPERRLLEQERYRRPDDPALILENPDGRRELRGSGIAEFTNVEFTDYGIENERWDEARSFSIRKFSNSAIRQFQILSSPATLKAACASRMPARIPVTRPPCWLSSRSANTPAMKTKAKGSEAISRS